MEGAWDVPDGPAVSQPHTSPQESCLPCPKEHPSRLNRLVGPVKSIQLQSLPLHPVGSCWYHVALHFSSAMHLLCTCI